MTVYLLLFQSLVSGGVGNRRIPTTNASVPQPVKQSCVGRCGLPPDSNHQCQCNTACKTYNDCCDDYDAFCLGGLLIFAEPIRCMKTIGKPRQIPLPYSLLSAGVGYRPIPTTNVSVTRLVKRTMTVYLLLFQSLVSGGVGYRQIPTTNISVTRLVKRTMTVYLLLFQSLVSGGLGYRQIPTTNVSVTRPVKPVCKTYNDCIFTSISESCVGMCGLPPDSNHQCQCNTAFKTYNDCIFSSISESCVGRCGLPPDSNHQCQCNTACKTYNDCCDDYDAFCLGGLLIFAEPIRCMKTIGKPRQIPLPYVRCAEIYRMYEIQCIRPPIM
ncbi:ENDOU [Mytilus edulis]|uniref:ENDOU n=1 Tax=Mytilus edulis TaxID=6550 RepID=A0A8S3RKZ3_MYTED|nr:ENDOU [Mytilus edulis]